MSSSGTIRLPMGNPPSYPMPSMLSFCPGGVNYQGGDDTWCHLASFSYDASVNNPTTPSRSHRDSQLIDQLVYRAKMADDRLRQYALLYGGGDTNIPHYLPSLSVLAQACFGRLTGVRAGVVKTWADAMVLQYKEESTAEQPPASEEEILNAKPAAMSSVTESVASVLKQLLKEAEERQRSNDESSQSYRPRPCGYVFKRGDIAWNCRTCQTDSTCVICDNCFRNSDHDGHEVYFHRTTPGGCCDCGDIEAWKLEGCCDMHRPVSFTKVETSVDDPFEAARMAQKGLQEGIETLKNPQTTLPPKLAAALGIVIGAAVNCLVQAVDGAGIGADPVQWKLRWTDEASKILNGAVHNYEFNNRPATVTPRSFLTNTNVQSFPNNFRLILRLHNDDVHTFDEVIEALHEPRHPRRNTTNNDDQQPQPLVTLREAANEMTHHVDADGQVHVKTYSAVAPAMQGYRRLKSKGLHCSVVSSAQVDMEQRARSLSAWLAEVASAHPAAAVLVVHALVQANNQHDLAGVQVWHEPRIIPPWAALDQANDADTCRRRFFAFPPHLASSYLTMEEAERLYELGLETNTSAFLELTGTNAGFYSNVPYNLPPERYRKSPHALWGSLPSFFSDPVPPTEKHPLLYRLVPGGSDVVAVSMANNLTETVFVVDTDLRKQQEADRITNSVYAHKLPGLHLISGVGTVRASSLDKNRPSLPNPMEWRHLLSISSFRAPVSPIITLLLLDPYPTKQLRGAIHALFLSLLIDARFKCRFAAALGIAYRPLSTLFCAGIGTDADTPLGFTVQIFTAGSLVRALGSAPAMEQLLLPDGSGGAYDMSDSGASIGVFTIPIAHTIVRCVHTNLLGATKEVQMILKNTSSGNDLDSQEEGNQNPNDGLLPALTYVAGEHPLLSLLPAAPDDGFLDSRSTRHKRLPHLLRDLEYVIETPGTSMRLLLPQVFPTYQGPPLSTREKILPFFAVWARLLRLAQGMDPQKRKISGGHVEYEQNRWLEAFGLSLNFAGTRDALAESPTNSNSAIFTTTGDDGSHLASIQSAIGNLVCSLIKELKLWLYREGMLETGLPIPSGGTHGGTDLSQVEALQRSTLHVSASQLSAVMDTPVASPGNVNPVALSCATSVKMTEAQLELIEAALRMETNQQQYRPSGYSHAPTPASGGRPSLTSGAVMGDWLRVPHSPLAGDSLSFHLPLHRALAKSVKSLCGVVVPESVRNSNHEGWWKLPVLDEAVSNLANDQNATIPQHPLVPLILPILRSNNCRVVWSAGPDCSAQEDKRRKLRAKTVSANIAAAKIIHSLADHPIRCLAAAQQIERHLWARNGSSTAGMALNYSSTPLCRSFRDLDLTLVQLSAAGMSIGLGARRVFNLLISRFSMDGYLCDPERRGQLGTAAASSAFGTGSGYWVNPPRLQDPDHAVVLSEAFFTTLCVIVTELPPPPPISSEDETWLRQSIKRELVHTLAAEPRSYSAALAAASYAVSRRDESDGSAGTSVGRGLFRDVFADVLREVGKQKSQGSSRAASGPPAYELNPTHCDQYDPTFFHLRRIEHQHAMDVVSNLRKQKIAKTVKDQNSSDAHCLPLVCPPPRAHPRFLPCRLLLHLQSMDAAVRRSLLFALTGGLWLPPAEPDSKSGKTDDISTTSSTGAVAGPLGASLTETNRPGSSDVPVLTFSRRSHSTGSTKPHFQKRGSFSENDPSPPFSPEIVQASSVSFLEVLQLLTLQVHTLEECASLHRTLPHLDNESKLLSSGLSINSYLGRLVRVPDSLKDVWALRPFPDGPLKSKGSGECRGSILGLLIALYEHRADHGAGAGPNGGQDQGGGEHGGARALAASGLKWLLRFVNALVDGAPSVSTAIKSATTGVPIKKPTAVTTTAITSDSTWTIDETVRTTISAMLTDLADLWPQPKENSPDKSQANEANGKSKERGKAAQKRMLEMMKKKQNAFQALMVPSSTGQESKNDVEEESDLCIICRCDDADGETNGPLGFLGHVQRSRAPEMRLLREAASKEVDNLQPVPLFHTYQVVGHMGCQLRETEAMDSKPLTCLPRGSIVTILKNTVSDSYDILSRRVLVRYIDENQNGAVTEGWASVQSSQGYVILSPLVSLCFENTRWGSTRPIIRQCGHAAHFKCVETHTLSLHQRAAGEQPYDGRFAANIDDGEFLCPLCKQLSNILIPRDGCARKVKSGEDLSGSDTTKAKKPNSKPSLRQLLTQGTIISEAKSSQLSDVGQKALADFGSHLLQAMDVPWDRATGSRKRKHRRWHPAIQKWDYEEGDGSSLPDSIPSVKNVMRLLRQQHIAWAAVGHSAAASEASTRGLEEVLPFGVFPKTDDPWSDYDASKDNHPMLLELNRTLTGASGLLEVFVVELENKLGTQNENNQNKVSVVAGCIADILEGRSWFQLAAKIGSDDTQIHDKEQLVLWSQLTSLMSSMPSHVARDGMLCQRNEARAVAAAMWVVRGLGSQQKGSSEPPAPLAINQIYASSSSTAVSIPAGWGTTSPTVPNEEKDENMSRVDPPFRPAVASAFLYTPLLTWDLNTFTAAVLSTMLLNETDELPTSDDVLDVARLLVVARLIQAIIVPNGYDKPDLDSMEDDEDEDEEGRWAPGDIATQETALANLLKKCWVVLSTYFPNPPETAANSKNLFGSLGRAILPYCRSLILMLRSFSSVMKQRQRKMTDDSHPSEGDNRVMELISGSESMSTSDGFFIMKLMGGPLPSAIVDGHWWEYINRWLIAVAGLELHHGSRGDTIISQITQGETGGQASGSFVTSSSGIGSRPREPMELDTGIHDQSNSQPTSGDSAKVLPANDDASGDDDAMDGGLAQMQLQPAQRFFDGQGDHDSEEDLADEVDMDDAEEMIGLVDPQGIPPFAANRSDNAQDGTDESADDDNSSSGSDGESENNDNSYIFARVSRSPILHHQPSLLGLKEVGPGKQGSVFEVTAASSVMADLSYLGLVHRKNSPTFSLIRLPKSFVELYGIVNKVKGRDDSATFDEADEVGSTETAICLLTGAVMRSGSSRRNYNRAQRPPGACTMHARKNGSGIGIFFLIQKCTVLLMHNNKSAYSASLYVDEHGEEDPGLRRGRPLFLNEARYRALEVLWRQQGIPREVAQIRSTSDRVIRDNWY